MILVGDTVRLKVHFKTFDGSLVDPSSITLTIYDETKTQIEQFNLTDSDKETVGVYYYDYLVPNNKELIFEFAGLFNNKPILSRDRLKIQFTK